MHTIKIMWKNSGMEIFSAYNILSDRRDDGSYLLSFEDCEGEQFTRLLKTPGDAAFIMAGAETIHAMRVQGRE